MIVIGLTGLAGSGKDTAADYLVERHGFKKMAFANVLKDMLNTLNPIVSDDGTRLMDVRRACAADVNAELMLKRHYPEYRRLLQTLGTDCVRAIDNSFWVKELLAQIDKLPRTQNVVVTDCRFPNEVSDLAHEGFDTVGFWQVTRPGLPKPGNVHSSESWAGKMGESLLVNAADKPALYAEVDRLLDELISHG